MTSASSRTASARRCFACRACCHRTPSRLRRAKATTCVPAPAASSTTPASKRSPTSSTSARGPPSRPTADPYSLDREANHVISSRDQPGQSDLLSVRHRSVRIDGRDHRGRPLEGEFRRRRPQQDPLHAGHQLLEVRRRAQLFRRRRARLWRGSTPPPPPARPPPPPPAPSPPPPPAP